MFVSYMAAARQAAGLSRPHPAAFRPSLKSREFAAKSHFVGRKGWCVSLRTRLFFRDPAFSRFSRSSFETAFLDTSESFPFETDGAAALKIVRGSGSPLRVPAVTPAR